MEVNTTSTARRLVRAIALGVLLSMAFFYSVHVMGSWAVENYRPDPETTSTLLLHNKCAVLGDMHTLRPNTEIPAMDGGINGMKLSGSFMNFFDGHIVAMVVVALLTGVLIFVFRNMIKRSS